MPLSPEAFLAQLLQSTTPQTVAATPAQPAAQTVQPTTNTQQPTAQTNNTGIATPHINISAPPKPTSSFHNSILGAISKQKEEEKKVEEKLAAIQKRTSFSQEDMIRQWNKYLSTKEPNTILRNTMETCKPDLVNDHLLIQTVFNATQQSEMLNERVQLLNYLRESLSNGAIDIDIRVAEIQESARSLTPNERLRRLVESNPSFSAFREEYKLELEF